MRPLQRGIFITFEGGEGAGKSTLIEEVARQLASDGYQIVKTREPGGTHLGEHIRSLLLEHSAHPLSAFAELSLYLAARAQHIEEVIAPALNVCKIVLCDRFNDSTIAYQGVGRNLGADRVEEFCEFICHGVLPDLTIYLDIDPALGLSRARSGSLPVPGERGYDRIESEGLSFHQKVREAFLAIHKKHPRRFLCLNADRPPVVISSDAILLIRKILFTVSS